MNRDKNQQSRVYYLSKWVLKRPNLSIKWRQSNRKESSLKIPAQQNCTDNNMKNPTASNPL